MRTLFFLFVFVNSLLALSPVGEEIICGFDIKSDKKAEKVFSFLENYDFKKSFFEDWDIIEKESFFKYSYFDTEDLRLYKNSQEALLLEEKKGNGKREFIIFDDLRFKVKRYKKQISFYDKHPLFGSVKRIERGEFLKKLSSLGIETPLKLKNLFNLTKINWEIIIEKDNTPYAIITLQKSVLEDFILDPYFYRLIFKIKAKEYITLKERLFLEKFLDSLKKEIEKNFSLKSKIYKNEYCADLDYLKNNVIFFAFAIKHPTLYYFLFALSIGIIGLAIFFVLFKFFDRKTTESQ